MRIGNVVVDRKVMLAPLSGITDLPFRLIARRHGAGLVFVPMVSAQAVARGNRKTLDMLASEPAEHPLAVQIFGSDPDIMEQCARALAKFRFDVLDINLGCPVRKVVKSGSGAALLTKPKLVREIAARVVNCAQVPVTAKIRSGWDAQTITAVDIAQVLEESGVAAVTIHPRTAAQGFSGRADWALIAEVKRTLSIPVIGNGDIEVPGDAKRMFEETACDFVMVGRAALGNPWIFKQIDHYLDTGLTMPAPSYGERIEELLSHIKLAVRYEGTRPGLLKMRKHASWYLRGMPGAAAVRNKINRCESEEELRQIIEAYRAGNTASASFWQGNCS